ncbi:MAG: sugar ABC transporter ATP-binding protein [Christensenellales bacterium]|jgi:ribose transport system ATP-binding protein
MNQEVLRIKDICKNYPGTKALINVNLSLQKGEIHIVLGENGAGKSTLLKILAGAIIKDSGVIIIDGIPAEINNPKQAGDLGICCVYQEPELFPDMTVYENLFLGNSFLIKNFLGLARADEKKMVEITKHIFAKMNININPYETVRNLSFALKQFLQLARIYVRNPRIILIDEISASLNEIEIKKIFDILNEFKEEGKAILYMTPKIAEAKSIGDMVTILKDGREVLTEKVKEIMPDSLIKLMLGEDLKNRYPKLNVDIGREVLRVEGVCGKAISDINFTLYKGEILGVAGLMGAGRSNLARTIIGLDKMSNGKIFVNAKEVRIRSPLDAVKNGMGLISENRDKQGLLLMSSVAENITLSNLKLVLKHRIISSNKEKILVKDLVDRLDIKVNDIGQEVASLSGGNKQKTLIARCLCSNSKIFIFDEPTKGVDTAGKIEIYNIMNELLRKGASILFISSDFSELVGMSNRVLVMKDGTFIKEIPRDKSSIKTLFYYASGSPVEDDDQ